MSNNLPIYLILSKKKKPDGGFCLLISVVKDNKIILLDKDKDNYTYFNLDKLEIIIVHITIDK